MLSGTGWKPQEPDERDYTPTHPRVRFRYGLLRSLTLPITQDHRDKCTPIEDQGSLGSCTAQSAVAAVEFLDNLDGVYTDGSRLFEYYNSRLIGGYLGEGDTGATIRDSIKALKEYGLCPEEKWQYHIEDFEVKPPADRYEEAQRYQLLTYVSLNNLSDIKSSLNGGIPVTFGFNVYESIYDTNTGTIPYPSNTELMTGEIGGHAVLAVGWDDTKQITNHRNGATTTGALLIRNSWGTTWGELGYGWLPYKYITGGLASDYWALLTMEDPDTDPTPQPEPEEDKDDGFYGVLAALFRMLIAWIMSLIK